MIKSKHFNKILFTFLSLMLIFTILITYFPDNLSLQSSGKVDMEYESKLFQSDEIMTVDIKIDESTWESMLENATAEEYVVCDIVINGETYNNVGIRPKGNTSLTQIASDDTTDRYSFKIEFDKYVDGQSCYGLDKLVLNNIMSDATYMKEYLAYDMFNYMGVVSSLYSYASITVNGEPWGLYLALEGYEESFAQRNYGYDYGELYKPESTNMGGGKGDDMELPSDDTFKDMQEKMENQGMENQGMDNKGGAFPSGMTPPTDNMANTDSTDNSTNTDNMANSDPQNNTGVPANPNSNNNPDSTTNSDSSSTDESSETQEFSFGNRGNRENMGGNGFGMGEGSTGNGCSLVYTDDEISSYSAIWESSVFDTTDEDYQRVITALKNISEGNLEDYMDIEATLKYAAVNTILVNYDSYFGSLMNNYYLYESDGKLTMLPWDFNLAFAGFNSNDATSAVNSPIDTPVSGTTLEARPFIGKLLEVEEYMDQYHSYLQQMVDEYFNSGLWEVRIAQIDALISEYVKNDATAFYTYDEYKTAVETLKEFGLLRAESIEGQLDGTIPSTEEEQQSNQAALIDASNINITAMGTQGGGQNMGGMNSTFPPMGNMNGAPGNGTSEEDTSGDAEDGIVNEGTTGETNNGTENEDVIGMPENGTDGADNNGMPSGGAMPGGTEMPSGGTMPDGTEMPSGDQMQRPSAPGSTTSTSGTGVPNMPQNQSSIMNQVIYLGIMFGSVIIGIIFAKCYKRRRVK